MGLLDALSAGIGAAAPAGAALAQGQAQATQSNTGFLEKLAQMQQQRQAADMQRQLQTAQIGDIQAQQKQREQQADALAKKFTPENVGAMAKQWDVDVNTAEAMMRDPATLRTVLESKKNPASIPGTKEWKEAETFKAGLIPRTKLTPVVDPSDPTGQRIIYVPSEQAAGMRAPTKLGAAGKAGGALANRQKDYIGLMDQGIGDMESLSSKIDPYLITAAIKSPMLANPLLGDNEQQYLASARNFLAGVLHEESGARLSDTQLAFGVQRYFPIGGDSPKVIATKLANAKATLAERKRNANYVPPGAPLSPQAQTEISTSASTAPSDATSNMLRPATPGTVPKGMFQSPTAGQPSGKPLDPKLGIFGIP